jgi:hypothetical protein
VVPASLPGCWRPQCRGLSGMAGPLTVVIPAARALSRQRGGPSIPSWVLATTVQGTQRYGWSPHSCDSRCSCFVTQHSGPSIPSWVLATTVEGTQRYGWSPHCCDSRCPCFVTVAWWSQHPFVGAGDHSVGVSAVWLVPSLLGFPLLVLCHGSIAVPASLPGCWRPQCRGLGGMAGPLTVVIPAARAWSRRRGGLSIPSWVLVTTV